MVSRTEAQALLRAAMESPTVDFREGQWEAIDHIVNRRGKVLCIQRTGWGKSMVYFVAAKLMREQGYGVTLIVSPLLALMRNQIDAANRLHLNALTINSTNQANWGAIRQQLLANRADLLLISPERLANDEFVTNVLLPIGARIGMLVIDEAHCVSDWGHDFRPDYRRIGQVLRLLPNNIAVLATTATANRRVEGDLGAQLGDEVLIQRGPLMRSTLALQVIPTLSVAERLAWLADRLPQLPGSGIVYTLTTRDADRVAAWLQQKGIDAHAYYSELPPQTRDHLEKALLANGLKCLVATVALGMGFDKPDLTFVIHFQTPGSVVGYYQQVGRAGRAIQQAYGVLMAGQEDSDINEYFRSAAFPPEWQVDRILSALSESQDGMNIRDLEREVNLRQSQIEKVLKLLVVEPSSPVLRIGATWFRTSNAYNMDHERIAHLTRQRELEWQQMQRYVEGGQCLMQFLSEALDDDACEPCGRCAVCLQQPVLPIEISRSNLIDAQRFVRHSELPLQLKKQWDLPALAQYTGQYAWRGQNIPQDLRGEDGHVLSRWGEPVWGALVARGKAEGRFDDELVAASAELVKRRWPQGARAAWVACIPSLRHPGLVPDFAQRLAAALGIPFRNAVQKKRETEPQKEMENRFHQCHNLDGAFSVDLDLCYCDPVLLVDDIVDSAWTLTLTAALLRQAGVTAVLPFALATTAAK